MDDLTALQALTDSVTAEEVHLFQPREAVLWKRDFRQDRAVTGNKTWTGENPPVGTAIHYHLASAPAGDAAIQITNVVTGDLVRDLEGTTVAGLNRVQWDLRANPEEEDDERGPVVEAGTYSVTLTVGGTQQSALIEVLEDVWMMDIP
jgi:hypothetical protein